MSSTRVLVVDDEPAILSTLKKALGFEGFSVEVAGGVGIAREKMKKESFAAALLDVGLSDGNGLDFLAELRAESPETVCIVMTGQASVDRAVTAIRLGAVDFLEKPISTDRLLVTLNNSIALRRSEAEAEELRRAAYGTSELLGRSPVMVKLRETVARAARSPAPVLVAGERGTGKELVARALHQGSPRRDRPLEKLNCAAVPENLIESELFGHEAGAFTGATRRRAGRFERAHTGTLFLDEVGDMPQPMQAKLLRVLQEQEVEPVGAAAPLRVDVRVIAATNQDLEAMVKAGRFRADLLDRLHVVPIALPPLRARRDDIPELSGVFLDWARERSGRPEVNFDADALAALAAYSFPGNVRELRNVIERLVILAADARITRDEVSACLGAAAGPVAETGTLYRSGVPFRILVEEAERSILSEALAAHGGQMAKTARALGLERSHLYKKSKALGLRGGEEASSGEEEAE